MNPLIIYKIGAKKFKLCKLCLQKIVSRSWHSIYCLECSKERITMKIKARTTRLKYGEY